MTFPWLDVGLCVLHVSTGAFFATTGYRKLFNPLVHAKFGHFLSSLGLPRLSVYMVMAGEFLGGLGLLFGCLTRMAAIGLLVIMTGAFIKDTFSSVKKRVAAESGNWSAWVSHILCTPETQLIVILVALIFTGAGSFSVDAILF